MIQLLTHKESFVTTYWYNDATCRKSN